MKPLTFIFRHVTTKGIFIGINYYRSFTKQFYYLFSKNHHHRRVGGGKRKYHVVETGYEKDEYI